MLRILQAMSIAAVAAMALPATAQDACVEERLTPSDAQSSKYFGSAIAVHEGTMVIGAFQDSELALRAGAAYVYEWIDGQWVEVQKLMASDGQMDDGFGHAVAINESRIAVRSRLHAHPSAPALGAVYIFEHDGSEWVEIAEIYPSTPTAGQFGSALSLRDDLLVVGASSDSANAPAGGAAYVYRFNGADWVEEQQLIATDGEHSHGFGFSVAIVEDILLIGAPGHTGACKDDPFYEDSCEWCASGAVYLFRYDESSAKWFESEIVTASDALCLKYFGYAMAAWNDWVVISAYATAWQTPEAYLIRYDADRQKFVELQKLEQWPVGTQYGRNVAISQHRALVGDHSLQFFGDPKGATYVFEPDEDGVWKQTAILRPEPNPWIPFFALRALALAGDQAFVGATGEDNTAGAVYAFDLAPTPGDLDCDKVVTGADLALMLASWGACEQCEHCPADLNGDCTVNGADLAVLLGNWG